MHDIFKEPLIDKRLLGQYSTGANIKQINCRKTRKRKL